MTSPDTERLLAELGWTRRLAFSLVDGDDGEAEEVVQETWVAALRARPSAQRPLRPWLRQVALNLVRDRVRAVRRRRAREEAGPLEATPVTTPEELLARAELQRRLVGLVLELEEPLKLTVLQRYFEGRSAIEIARASGTPPGTVRWRLKRALDLLRDRVAASLADEAADGAGPQAGDRQARLRRALVGLVPAAGGGQQSPGSGAGRGAPAFGSVGARDGLAARGPCGPARPSLFVAGAAALVLVVTVVGVRTWPSLDAPARSPSSAPAPAGTAAPSPAGPGEAPRPSQPSSARQLAACLEQIALAQPELRALREKRHRWVGPRRLFEEGAPNPRAWLTLDPLARRLLAGDEPVLPSYVLECRTWACRLVLFEDEVATTAAGTRAPDWRLLAATQPDPAAFLRALEPRWNVRLQTDPDLRARIAGLAQAPLTPSFDPLARKPVLRREIFLQLADPSGEPRPAGSTFAPPAWGAGAPVPTTITACDRSLRALRAEMERVRAEVREATPSRERYRVAPPDPGLTSAFAAHVAAVTGAKLPPHLGIDCRGAICRLAGARGAFELEALARPLLRRGPLRSRLDRLASSDQDVLFAVAPRDRPDGYQLLTERIARLRAAGEVTACSAAHPASGSLRVRLVAPDPAGPFLNDDGVKDRISLRLGGQLAGGGFAACLAEAIERQVVAPGLPETLRGATYDERWEIPGG